MINKYQHEVNKHGNKAKSLQRVISKVGNATLMTNVTTASGFATFIITQSKLLTEFGIVASLSIIAIFLLCLFIIPIIYSFMPIPKEKHLEHLNKRWINQLGDWIDRTVKHHNIAIYSAAVILLAISIIGIFQIKATGSLIEDMPKKAEFYSDIEFYESEFNGVMPLEILVDTKRKKGVLKLSTLKRMSALENLIVEIPELSKPISVVSLVKYSKQAYYNGNPKYFQLPTAQENNFIMSYAKNASPDIDLLKNFVDSTGRYARITSFMKDTGIDKMERIEEDLITEIDKLFPKDKYNVSITGKAYLFQKGTKYLVRNLILSLALAIFLISLFMAYMFRSLRMIIISLIPNLLPLLITSGIMGYFGVPIKPSTILVFSIAFGISVISHTFYLVTHSSFFLNEKLEWMDENKIDHGVVLNLSQLYGNGLRLEEMKKALRFQNDFNAKVQLENASKFTCGFVVHPGFIQGALWETERCVKELDLKVLCLPTHFMDSIGQWRSVFDKENDPIFELANEYNLAIEVHIYDGEKMIK